MKFFLAAIVTAALLAEIIPVWAADPGNDKIKNKAPSVHTEADNSNGHPPEGISITPQTQAQRLAAATAKAQPNAKTPADTASNATSSVDSDIKTPPADMQPEPTKPVIKKIKPPIPEEKPLRVIWLQDFLLLIVLRILFHFFHPHRHILSSPHLNPDFSFINFRKFFCGHIPGVDQFNLYFFQLAACSCGTVGGRSRSSTGSSFRRRGGIRNPSFLRGFPG